MNLYYVKLLGAFLAVVLTTFGIFAYVQGCEERKFQEKQNNAKVPELTKMYWTLYSLRKDDSIRESQALDDLYDSLFDFRTDLDYLYEKSKAEKQIFRN